MPSQPLRVYQGDTRPAGGPISSLPSPLIPPLFQRPHVPIQILIRKWTKLTSLPIPPVSPHGFNYDISKTSLLYRLSLICFWHLRTLSKNRTNEQPMEQKYQIHHKTPFFCSSFVKSKPAWLFPEKFQLKKKRKTFLYDYCIAVNCFWE